ncbi:MAG: hypothetical protein IJ087_22105 [Eggerthellaceae bacterium]|nr:hypothetical protein [Eggerthellaceae bacterium]
MAKATTYQCPNCNGVLSYNAQAGKLECSFCGGSFSESEVERAIPLGSGAAADQMEHVKTVEEFLEHAPWETTGANAENAIGYSCPACGASVVADRSAVTAGCPFCGNNMLVSGIATAENLPQKVIPFSLTRDEAIARMREHFNHKWYLSRRFSAQVEHLQGVYVPYYLYDLRASGWGDYVGAHETSTGKGGKIETGHIALHRAGYVDIEGLPVDGSSKMPDAHMDAIAPFDFSQMRDFSASYVAGYLAEVPDESPKACFGRADTRARKPFEDRLEASARATRGVDSVDVVASHTDVGLTGVSTCLLPVWLMHCTWESNQMLFAVNGQTGKCVGDLPVDKTRRAITLAVAIVIALLIAGPMLFEFFREGDIPDLMYVIPFAILCAPFILDAGFKDQMKTAVESDDDGLDYSVGGFVVTESWNGPKFHLNRNKALADLGNRPTSAAGSESSSEPPV